MRRIAGACRALLPPPLGRPSHRGVRGGRTNRRYMGRRFRGRVRPNKPEHRVNHRIRFPKIRVIDPDGNMIGVMSPDEGRAKAKEFGLDLVEVSPQARPPVCKIMDYGKFKYEKSKAKSAAKSSTPTMKTVQMRPKTDDHDLETKLRRARKFLKRGDKVRIVMRMRGRERGYPQRWIEMLQETYQESLANLGRIASKPTQQGRVIAMVVEPTTT
ncbi:MAG TPA: translation initiation factor IF-3 [Polyangiaceae bacterium LLY-WYZ-15_(1-7)]|nr:translation initiation factor IF-3 [Myxococcales bacterium]MAT23390.1 translation initiation factor IF-3 [Sandaracinus sp.]HJL04652.1 translation initiation factor IF-3 [Polyangiaceae bacterium LLY-WYZ-15_(1-7)]MBJ75158.1 translation initiation factor IF-3 [Sandaracinus sp.]HJL07434.1 translation initiation factor IF-3 [Polyangiaceae bacterium LLY-WYZ-15_(1-7)]